jgi:hypothetical protein
VVFEAIEGRVIVMAGLGPTGAEIAVRNGVLPVMARLGRAICRRERVDADGPVEPGHEREEAEVEVPRLHVNLAPMGSGLAMTFWQDVLRPRTPVSGRAMLDLAVPNARSPIANAATDTVARPRPNKQKALRGSPGNPACR